MRAPRVFLCGFAASCVLALPSPKERVTRQLYGNSSDIPFYGNSSGVPGGDATFDYVVLGGGTAGLAIAGRLAANPGTSVAVIEAGGFYEIDNGNGSIIPALAPLQHIGSLPNDTQPLIDWSFVTVPQAGANHRRMHYAQGKTLGGSSARNYLAYHRGTNESYQQWAEQVGDDSYLYPNFLPFFQRSCHLTPPNLEKRYPPNATVSFNPAAYDNSLGGPLQVSWANWGNPIGTWAQKGLTTAGMPSINGFDSGTLFGSSWMAQTLEPTKQERSSSETSYLRQALRNTSIVVYKRTLGRKILFKSNNTAYGVSVETAGQNYTLRAKKEVILSAGAFQSPHLLMVSGIGPAQTLSKYGIPIISDLPGVGQNLWDQPQFGASFRVNVDTSSRLVIDPAYAAQAGKDYVLNQTGPLTDLGAYIGFEKLPSSYRQYFTASTRSRLNLTFPADWPEIEYISEPSFGGYNTNYSITPTDGYEYATIAAVMVAPLSRGNVTISSANAADPPVINPNWITDPADIEVAIATFKRVREIWSYMNGTTIGPEYFPGTTNVKTDAEILNYIRESLTTIWHASATCKMGKADDPMAVIDSHARVFGVKALRVVDASSFPFLPPGHPQSTVYALAEKIARDILTGG
ncbi:MAG: hypothetical protein Q9181_005793 [Wetmoreana brouardii]